MEDRIEREIVPIAIERKWQKEKHHLRDAFLFCDLKRKNVKLFNGRYRKYFTTGIYDIASKYQLNTTTSFCIYYSLITLWTF